MYLLFALILYLKTKGIAVAWYWYVLAFCEVFDASNKNIKIRKIIKEQTNEK